MPRRTHYTAAIAVVAILAGYSIGRADSPYPKGASAPVIFTGYLSTAGAPVSGSHDISMNLWQATDTSVASNRVCQGSIQSLDVNAGTFKLTLDAACVDAFSRYTQVWYQLVVDGTAFPLEQIGSVPFAARAGQGYANGSRLAQSRDVIYGDDGLRGDPSKVIKDTARDEQCSPLKTSEGIVRCLPSGESSKPFDPYGLFLDSSCTQPAPSAGTKYYSHNNGSPGPQVERYLVDLDDTGNVTAIHQATGKALSLYIRDFSSACQYYYGTGVNFQYTVGAAIPLTDFVQVQTVTE
jgi:hypothetical protein